MLLLLNFAIVDFVKYDQSFRDLATGSVLDLERSYLLLLRWGVALQVLFLTLNLSLSLITVSLGQDFYGVGYFLACLVSSFLAYIMAVATFENLNFLTFIGNNPSIIPSETQAQRPWYDLR